MFVRNEIERLQRTEEAIVVATGAPRRVMAGHERDLRLSAFEASAFANCEHNVAYVGGR
jgi:hypothetical protein